MPKFLSVIIVIVSILVVIRLFFVVIGYFIDKKGEW